MYLPKDDKEARAIHAAYLARKTVRVDGRLCTVEAMTRGIPARYVLKPVEVE